VNKVKVKMVADTENYKVVTYYVVLSGSQIAK
jgi:hypothetical protein